MTTKQYDTLVLIEEKIKKQKQELAELQAQLEQAKLESPDKQLAKELHSMLCNWNHTDGCGWYYEMKNKQDDWLGYAHGTYLAKAQKLIHSCTQEGITVDKAVTVLKLVKGI